MKICNKCKGEYPIDNFYTNKPCKDGHIGVCKNCETIYRRKWRSENRDKIRETAKRFRYERRMKILRHYSRGRPVCACCGEKQLEFLGIDHINGGGARLRKKLGGGSVVLNEWIIKNNYPRGLRVLCHNCNLSIGFYGYCPHSRESGDTLQTGSSTSDKSTRKRLKGQSNG